MGCNCMIGRNEIEEIDDQRIQQLSKKEKYN